MKRNLKKNVKKRSGLLLLLLSGLCFGCEEEPAYPAVAAQVVVSERAITLDPGESQLLSAAVFPADAGNTAVAWRSLNERVATVVNGLITAVAPGTATVLVTAYSNADARGEVAVTVAGVPDDLAAAVAGTYVGDVTMGGMPIATDVEVTLTAAGNAVRLATTAVTGMGALSMDIEVDVLRDGSGYAISGAGTSTLGAVSVAGAIDADGNMTLNINLHDQSLVVVFTARRGQTPVQAVAGTYDGAVGIPMMGTLPDIELVLTPEGAIARLTTTVVVPSFGTLDMDIPVTVVRAGSDYALSGAGTTALFGPVSISGTVSATGAISLIIHIDANGMDVTYIGQKREDLAALVAGAYTGTVSAQGMGAITGNDVVMILTAGNQTTVHWETHTTTPLGAFDVVDFPLTVARSGSGFTLAGSGTTSVGPLDVTGTIYASGHVVVEMTGPGLPVIISYEGQK
ncbi:MAG: Ig-like domain-containing protein [Prevotellaceae bacterium]|jgi:hypothetical protein|nr:Ig-like domain-containing protein [Prevotellaceae bacterium]